MTALWCLIINLHLVIAGWVNFLTHFMLLVFFFTLKAALIYKITYNVSNKNT